MTNFDNLVFAVLFKDAYLKCFGYDLENPLSETESKLLCTRVFDETGLSIGWKSVKNYSIFIVNPAAGKTENPSTATLDTLSRYVLGAPYTSEIKRKNDEGHYPYWFLYKEKYLRSVNSVKKPLPKRWLAGILVFISGIGVVVLTVMYFNKITMPQQFTDYFRSVDSKALIQEGWYIKDPDTAWWNKRGKNAGQLTLFTLKGDNWPKPETKPVIKNLLIKPIPYDCFTAEVHLTNFIPLQEWQQAGILLLEDTVLTGKSIRLSIAFNDYFGGYKKPKEILIQAITSLGNGFGKPEEIAHQAIMYPDSAAKNPALINNLNYSALRIEKHGKKYRLLYSGGAFENTAFKQVADIDFDMQPRYIGLFAIKGFMDSSPVIPARFTYFKLVNNDCKD